MPATYLGISGSRFTKHGNSLKIYTGGMEIVPEVTAGQQDVRKCKHYNLMPIHHPLPNCSFYETISFR